MKKSLFLLFFCIFFSSVRTQVSADHLSCVLSYYESFFAALNILNFDQDLYKMFFPPNGPQGTQLYQYLVTREKLFICQAKSAETNNLCVDEKDTAVSNKQTVNWFLNLISLTPEYTEFQGLAGKATIGNKDLVGIANSIITLLNEMKCVDAGKQKASLYKN